MKVIYPVVEVDTASLLSLLPEWRLKKTLAFKNDIDRFLCAKSYLLLCDLLRSCYGIDTMPEFTYGPYGKPELKGFDGIYFNMSHCRKGIICAVSDKAVGVDIEEIQYHADLLEYCFSEDERSLIEKSGSPDVRFTELWTRKESYLKMKGIGLVDNFADVSPVGTITEVCIEYGFVSSVSTL